MEKAGTLEKNAGHMRLLYGSESDVSLMSYPQVLFDELMDEADNKDDLDYSLLEQTRQGMEKP